MEKGTKQSRLRRFFSKDMSSLFSTKERVRPFWLSVIFTTIKIMLVLILLFGSVGAGLVMGIAKAYIDTTPMLDLSALTETSSKTSYIYDRNGNLITTFVGMEYREWADIEEIPDMLKNAVVSIEDVRFYKHDGLDYKRLVSAIINTFRNEDTHGGSTITQQLIKNTILTNVQSYKRKIQEAYLALELEGTSDKDAILEAYLNDIFFGDQNYGVKSAAKDYFGKELSDLSIRECAMLAGIIQKPTAYNPRLNTYTRRDPETGENYMWRTNERTDTVIRAMYNAGFITREQRDAALNDTVYIVEKSQKSAMYDMPYYVEYGIYDVITYMLKSQGLADTQANRDAMEMNLKTGGYHIYLNVDSEIQKILEEEVENYDNYPKLKNPDGAIRVVENEDGSVTEIIEPQVAAVIYDHNSGEIVAMVGGRTAPTQKGSWNRAYMGTIEVGSSIKPLAVYAPALDKGVISPATPIANLPGAIDGWNTDKGYPARNGVLDVVPVRQGVKSSMNVVAARVLMEKLGLDTAGDYVESLGVPDSQISRTGAGLALGATSMKPVQMVGAYGAIANGGVYQTPMAFSRVEDENHNVILDANDYRETRRVFKKSTAFMMIDILETAVESGTGTAARLSGMTVAGKTGTNGDYSSVCFSGITPYYTGFVWIGHDRPHEFVLSGSADGGHYAAPLWHNFMERIHKGLHDRSILDYDAKEAGVVYREVCSVSGLLATDACYADHIHSPISDYFDADNVPTEHCNMHVAVNTCLDSGLPAAPGCVNTAMSSFVLIGSDSPYINFSQEDIRQVFPNAIYTEQTAEEFTAGDNVCTEHAGGNAGLDVNDLIRTAQSLINHVQNYINDGAFSDEQKRVLQNDIFMLEYSISMRDGASIRRNTTTLRMHFELYAATQ